MALVKLPVPVPFVVLLFKIVGEGEVFQHTPRAVMSAPPSFVTLPPLTALVEVIQEAVVVVTIGKMAVVIIISSFP